MNTSLDKRAPGGTGVGIWTAIAGVMLAMQFITNIISFFTRDQVRARFENDPESRPTVSIDGVEQTLGNSYVMVVNSSALEGAAVPLLVISDVVFAIGILVATWYFSRCTSHMARGREATGAAITSLNRMLMALVVTIVLGGFLSSIGAARVEKQLGFEADNGYSTTTVFVALGVVGIFVALSAALRRSRAAETDAEGLV